MKFKLALSALVLACIALAVAVRAPAPPNATAPTMFQVALYGAFATTTLIGEWRDDYGEGGVIVTAQSGDEACTSWAAPIGKFSFTCAWTDKSKPIVVTACDEQGNCSYQTLSVSR